MDIANFLNFLNSYANLVLVIVTSVYVVLTWRMVREMRQAREAELVPHMIASLEQYGQTYAKIRLANAGQGPALSVSANISVKPQNDELTRRWNHPAMASESVMDFLMPSKNRQGTIPTLRQLTEEYESIVVAISWESAFGRKYNRKFEYSLEELMAGWYESGQLIPPDEIPVQFKNIHKELGNINKSVRDISKEMKRVTQELAKSSTEFGNDNSDAAK